jgi:hypothetical protein
MQFNFAKFIGIDQVKFFYNQFNATGSIEFTNSGFYGNQIIFESSNFTSNEENILFNNITLKGKEQIIFYITNFHAKRVISFRNTRFYGKNLEFNGAHFQSSEGVIFFDQKAKFVSMEKLDFRATDFHAKYPILFNKCEFNANKILFKQVKFQSSESAISFEQTEFHSKEGEIRFEYCELYAKDEISFDEQTKIVCDNITFNNTKFSNIHFKNIFLCRVYFEKSQFLNEASFSANTFQYEAYFDTVLFDKANKIYFLGDDLSNISFLKSDVTRIQFTDNAEFSKCKNKYKTFDEKRLEYNFIDYWDETLNQNLTEVNLGNLLTLYRDLRENYEYHMRYEGAGEFFIREMELKRNYRLKDNKIKKRNIWERNLSLTALYRSLGKYGESFARPSLLIFSVFIIAFIFWLSQSNPTTTEPSLLASEGFTKLYNGTHFIKSIERSFLDVTPLINFGVDRSLPDYIFKTIAVLGFGLLFISLRRKFERRFRH